MSDEHSINVLHIVHEFQTGGAERVILDLTLHSNPSIVNYVCSICEPHNLAQELDLTKTGFQCLKKQPGNDLRIVRDIARLIDREQIDVVHAQGWGTFVESLVAAKLYAKRKPAFIYAFHGKSMADVSVGIPFRRRITQRIAHVFTDACIAPADDMVEDYARTVGISPEKIELIYNGVDLERFGRAYQLGDRAALGLAETDFVVGFVGRLNAVKDIQGIVRIFAKVCETLRHEERAIRLLIVGGGSEQEAAERLASGLGIREKIVFAGLRSDVPKCLVMMNVYLQPSHYEGHSIAIMEATAAGLPVVSTRVGGTPEIVCHGQTGFLYAPGEYDLMAGAIVDLYRRPALCTEMGSAGRDFVKKNFSVTKMVKQYENLYYRVLGMLVPPCVE